MDEDIAPGWGSPGTPLDRILQRIGYLPSLPLPGRFCYTPALGPPAPEVDASLDRQAPPVDVVLTPRRVYVTIEIPGASREEIDIEATETGLRVQARCPDGAVYDRTIALPDRVDPSAATASYRNGVLDITIPRRARNQGGRGPGR